MQRRNLLLLVCFINCLIQLHEAAAQRLFQIIPKPVTVLEVQKPAVAIDGNTVIIYADKFKEQAHYLADELNKQCGWDLKAIPASAFKQGTAIQLRFDNTSAIDKEEMYRLQASGKSISIRAKSVRGIINGIQTLLQLLPYEKSASALVPACNIIDFPRCTQGLGVAARNVQIKRLLMVGLVARGHIIADDQG